MTVVCSGCGASFEPRSANPEICPRCREPLGQDYLEIPTALFRSIVNTPTWLNYQRRLFEIYTTHEGAIMQVEKDYKDDKAQARMVFGREVGIVKIPAKEAKKDVV